MLNKIIYFCIASSLLKTAKHRNIQTFTYFIPSPPKRDIGYREKQFDKYFYEFINKGYEIISINTQQCSDPNQSGMWFICTVRATNQDTQALDLSDSFAQEANDCEIIDNTVVYTPEIDENSNLKLHRE